MEDCRGCGEWEEDQWADDEIRSVSIIDWLDWLFYTMEFVNEKD